MDRIYLTQCKTYDLAAVRDAVRDCLACFGGAKAILATGKQGNASKTVLLKANLVKSARIEEAATTHPAVLQAVAEEFIAAGAHVLLGDCPAIPQTKPTMEALYRQTGLAEAAAQSGAELLYDFSSRTVTFEKGSKKREFSFWEPIFNVDLIVNCAKLKTHSFATMTGAAKNLFGLLPGLLKSAKHAENMSVTDFADMIVDLNLCVKETVPVFSFIDGIIGMEGKGPTGGTPKFCGALVASDSVYAADMAGITLMGLKPNAVPILNQAIKRGITPKNPKEYDWNGVSAESLATTFKLPKHHGVVHMLISAVLPERLTVRMRKNENPYPVINRQKCVSCAKCVEICPVHAATKNGKEINIDHSVCIRCYCCHEVCPKRAIDI